MQFEPWFDLPGQQIEIGEREKRLPLGEVNEEQALALPDLVVESLKSQSLEQIVSQLKESLQLDQASLEHPDPNIKKLIRCLARTAKCSNRLDVVEYMREIAPAGTSGPLLPEDLHVREILFIPEGRDLTIAMSGGDEWKVVADLLGFNVDKIRFLDKRTCNPAEALLGYITHERFTVGVLYDLLNDCGLPVLADKL